MIISSLAVILLGLGLIAHIYSSSIKIKTLTKQVHDLKSHTFHLYCLSEICGYSIESQVHRLLYEKLHNMNPISGTINMPSVMREVFIESYQIARNQIVALMSATENPELKDKMGEQLKDLDGIFNLLSTIDKDSEKNYTMSVLKDVQSTILRVASRMEKLRHE